MGRSHAPAEGEQTHSPDSAKRLKQQREDALANVREGYGGA